MWNPGTFLTSEDKSWWCEVTYSTSEPWHVAWAGDDQSNATAATRQTLLVRSCNSWSQCGAWAAGEARIQHDAARCVVAGPKVTPAVPTAAQRDMMDAALAPSGDLPGLLRIAFHDAATYSADQSRLANGANGCMRFEDIQGNLANMNIGILIDKPPQLISAYLQARGLPNVQPPFSSAGAVGAGQIPFRSHSDPIQIPFSYAGSQ